MTFNLDTINSRIQRVQNYFPDLEIQYIITNGVVAMDPREIRNEHVHKGLEEGTWSINLLRWVSDETNTSPKKATALREYIEAFTALEKRDQWGQWEVDSANNDWASIWVRLVDKLRVTIDKNGYVLPAEDAAKVADVYALYQNVKHGIDPRREKQNKIDAEFDIIFAGDQYKEVREAVLQPVTLQVTPKHCFQLLLEIPDTTKRETFIKLYFEALTTNCKVPLAKKLADYCPKHIEKYSKEFIGEAPEGDALLVSSCMEVFKAALAK